MPYNDPSADFFLKVHAHPGGRHTLMQSKKGATFTDLGGPLFGNDDRAEFYRAAFRYVGKLLTKGHIGRLDDDDDDAPDDQLSN